MKTKKINRAFAAVWTACFLTILAAPLYGFAQPAQEESEEGYRKGREGKAPKFLQELGLTEEQKEALKKLREGGAAQVKPLREQIEDKKKELKQVMAAETFDQAKAYALSDEITALTGKTMRVRIDEVAALKNILTPEQFKKMTEMRKEGQNRRKPWKEEFLKRRHSKEKKGPDGPEEGEHEPPGF